MSEKTNSIAIRFSDDEKTLIQALARTKGLSLSGILRQAIFEVYEKETGINLAAAVQARKNKGLE